MAIKDSETWSEADPTLPVRARHRGKYLDTMSLSVGRMMEIILLDFITDEHVQWWVLDYSYVQDVHTDQGKPYAPCTEEVPLARGYTDAVDLQH